MRARPFPNLSKSKLAYALMFAGCYAVFLYWQRPPARLDSAPTNAISRARTDQAPLRALNHVISLRESHSAATRQTNAGMELTEQDTPQALQAEQEKQLSDTAITAMGASNLDVRIAALQQLSGVATADVMMALNQSLHDRETRIRYVALDALRQLAANQGDADGGIRSLISSAMSDRDPQIAHKAQEIYQELNTALHLD